MPAIASGGRSPPRAGSQFSVPRCTPSRRSCSAGLKPAAVGRGVAGWGVAAGAGVAAGGVTLGGGVAAGAADGLAGGADGEAEGALAEAPHATRTITTSEAATKRLNRDIL